MTTSSVSTRPLSFKGHLRAVLGLGLPLIGGHLAQYAIGFTDTVMMARYGVDEVAALVLATSVFFVLFIAGSGFAWAVMPIVASSAGTNDDAQVRRVTRMGIWISILFGLFTMPIMIWSEPILIAIGQDPHLAELAQSYARIAVLGLIPALILMVLKSYLAALERTQIVLWVTVGMVIINAISNNALIFGNWGAPELGVRGAAISSVVIQVSGMIAVIVYAAKVTPQYTLFQRFWRPDWEAFGRVFTLGWPISLTGLAEVGLFTASIIMVGWVGTNELAAHGIVLNLSSATFMIHVGLSNAATIRAGQAYGQVDEAHLRLGAKAVTLLSLVFAGLTMAVFILFPAFLMDQVIGPNEIARDEIVRIGVVLFFLSALFQFGDAAQAIALGLLRGVQDTRAPMIIAAISYWIVGAPLGYVLGFVIGWDEVGVWIGLVVGLFVAGGLLMHRFWKRSVLLTASRVSSEIEATP